MPSIPNFDLTETGIKLLDDIAGELVPHHGTQVQSDLASEVRMQVGAADSAALHAQHQLARLVQVGEGLRRITRPTSVIRDRDVFPGLLQSMGLQQAPA